MLDQLLRRARLVGGARGGGRAGRREDLALPIPATIVLPTAAATDEARWQEQVIRRLDLSDWQRFDLDDELGLLGPYARRVLTAHGLLWPANMHFHLPLLEAARGGALLTRIGGDELFVPHGACARRPCGPEWFGLSRVMSCASDSRCLRTRCAERRLLAASMRRSPGWSMKHTRWCGRASSTTRPPSRSGSRNVWLVACDALPSGGPDSLEHIGRGRRC